MKEITQKLLEIKPGLQDKILRGSGGSEEACIVGEVAITTQHPQACNQEKARKAPDN